ncbi:heavy metal translocating P-type ATPase [Taibaiella soli]|uniref:Cadmium-translocating P-type ATPase n=1 Tax=Taibaiella soli TaxID=1649169 RepID=A0A2W2BGJ0_9BACT|nr:cation-translocating P-type ATPase [Taibaiella soli]PZF75027.1 cadmium-translocating P-type ATPase [Taibaiella soli]
MNKTYATRIEGMTCGNCALTVSKLLEKKGMTNISVNAVSGDANFTAAGDTDVVKIYDAIDGLGYHVIRDTDEADIHAGHHHHQSKHNDNTLLLICAAFTIPLLLHMFISWPFLHNPWVQLVLATPVFAIGCYSFMPSAFRSLKHGIPNMDVLIMIGASAAYIYSLAGLLLTNQAHHYLFFETTAAIITLVMFGNWLERQTVKSTSAAIDDLVRLQPQKARIVMTDSIGKESVMEVESKYVRNGDVVLVNHGDSVPVDGVIVHGTALLDEHMITGESMPVQKEINDAVVGGTLVQEGNLRVKATTVGAESVLSNIIRMVREAQATKPPMQKLADKISAIFVPAVLGIALITFLINYFAVSIDFEQSMMRAIAVMVISCPCAMGLATPAAVAVGLGRAARNGILVKGGDTLERMKTVKQIVFDKTGTLTTGQLQVEQVVTNGIDENNFRSVVVAIEQRSSHPIAKSIIAQWKNVHPVSFPTIEEIKGKGMQATDENGDVWQLGSERWLGTGAPSGHDLYLVKNGHYTGALSISDTLRDDAKETIETLHRHGYKTILLSGDKKDKCEKIAAALGIDEVYSEQSPEQKNNRLESYIKSAPTAMVGDGINDAPALAKATVGISLSDATHIAMQSANVILSNNKLSSLPKALRLGIYTDQTIRQNLFLAFFYNICAIPIAAVGLLSPTWGAGLMAVSDVVLILNSLRLGIRRL